MREENDNSSIDQDEHAPTINYPDRSNSQLPTIVIVDSEQDVDEGTLRSAFLNLAGDEPREQPEDGSGRDAAADQPRGCPIKPTGERLIQVNSPQRTVR